MNASRTAGAAMAARADRADERVGVMRAVVRDRYGAAEVLQLRELPRPRPATGQVVVRARAASLFAGDIFLLRGRPLLMRLATGVFRPRRPMIGIDVSGVVEEVGPGVSDLRPGDEVFGWSAGTLAEYVCDSADHFARRPGNLALDLASAVPETAMTALQGLRDAGRVTAGQRVMVIGASGGVGTFAVQIAKAFGAHVTAVCAARNAELVRSIGADDVIDSGPGVLDAVSERFDVIFQAAGTASPRRLRRILTRDGTLVLSSGQGRFNGVDRIITALVTSPFVSQRLVSFVTRENRDDLVALRELIEAGVVTPVIDRVYPLAAAADAVRYVAAGHTRGKVLITIAS